MTNLRSVSTELTLSQDCGLMGHVQDILVSSYLGSVYQDDILKLVIIGPCMKYLQTTTLSFWDEMCRENWYSVKKLTVSTVPSFVSFLYELGSR